VLAKLVRFLLIALIALAVPMQGALAVGTAQCLALEHHQPGTADDQNHGHDHSAGHQHQDSSVDEHDGQASHTHCGPCVACCASVSIAAAQPLPLRTAPAFAVDVLPKLLPAGDLPGGLYRPPLAL
jgi:hypothetical protein